MPRGGKREGAGRKVGSIPKIRRPAYEKAAEMGVEPILYSIEAVDCVMQQARIEQDEQKKMALYKLMHDMNKDLLAYFHRKMPQAVENKDVTQETWEDRIKRLEAENDAAIAKLLKKPQ